MLPYSLNKNGLRRRGVALLEFALVLPILMLLILGIVEFAWFTKNQQTVSNAAREGARIASLDRPTSEIRARVTNSAAPITISSIALQYSTDSGSTYTNLGDTAQNKNNAPPGSLIRVTVRAVHNPLTTLSLFGREIRVSVTMVRERT